MKILYHGGEILTPDNKVEALVCEDKKILYAGSLAGAEKIAEDAVRINIFDKILAPAFIDAHGHFSLSARYLAFADLSDCKTHADIEKALAEHSTGHKIVIARGFDETVTSGGIPTRELLDRAVPDKPVCILHASGHSCVINDNLARLCGLSEGGCIEEIPDLAPILKLALELEGSDFDSLAMQAQELYLASGITLAQDGALSKEGFAELVSLSERGMLKLDIDAYVNCDEYESTFLQYPEFTERRNRLRLAGAKLILDGSPQLRTAWLSKPYENGANGEPQLTDAQLESALASLLVRKIQLLLHCNGDAACEQALRAFEKYPRRDEIRESRPVLIHAQTIRRDQLERAARLGLITSFFPSHIPVWGDLHTRRLGRERANYLSPAKSALKLGIPFTLHLDAPVRKLDVPEALAAAMERTTASGVLLGEEERLELSEALRGVTANAAYQAREEQLRGRLAPGYSAELVLLERDGTKLRVLELLR